MAELKLVVFDVDGTLVDSQDDIVSAMTTTFEAIGEAVPSRADILGIVGLSLHAAFEKLTPALYPTHGDALVEGYKTSFMTSRKLRDSTQSSPLYSGALEAIERLYAQDNVLLGIATGKSRRGLDHLLDAHDLRRFFVTTQVADDHPSKPHPSMLERCMYDAGVEAAYAVMIGDTSYDMDMAANAAMASVGVSWGYHTPETLRKRANVVIEDYADLDAALTGIWSETP
ncbi:phosphoglycolate phosphatase [Litoreibacter halocynthiae]|uniref:Phosphoglycolate phosphatase n=1 Tax=Litoreibacter halocynthiae TaxID=1242689 RepID=A0A4R7LI11_9RHOB|nr:HAD-IA family hydrolase [Litoreibacter halocynthiae]TDT75418.1 phosphoglycolate phosphatase [Litoreibacter halocynthiae]